MFDEHGTKKQRLRNYVHALDPVPGDTWHEMFSCWMRVTAVSAKWVCVDWNNRNPERMTRGRFFKRLQYGGKEMTCKHTGVPLFWMDYGGNRKISGEIDPENIPLEKLSLPKQMEAAGYC